MLRKGDDIQKLSVIHIVPSLLALDSQGTISRILPRIHQQLPTSPCEFHVATSRVYATLMENKIPVNLLHIVLQGIDSRDPIVANAWMETLIRVIPTLTETQVKNEVRLLNIIFCTRLVLTFINSHHSVIYRNLLFQFTSRNELNIH